MRATESIKKKGGSQYNNPLIMEMYFWKWLKNVVICMQINLLFV